MSKWDWVLAGISTVVAVGLTLWFLASLIQAVVEAFQ